MEHPEAQEIEGVGEVRQIPATLSKKEILTMICDTTGIDIQYLFTRAGSERKAAIAPYRKLSCQDLHTHPAKSAASIFGIFPVVWGRPNRRTPQWAPFALAAHSFCATPLLGLTTLFPMQAHEAASVAAHLTSAALAESEESGAAQATKVAERLVEWLCGADHPSAPEFLVLAGHLGIPITPPPLPTGAETAKAIRERVGAGDLQGAIELTETAGFSKVATLYRHHLAVIEQMEIEAQAPENIDAKKSRLVKALLLLADKVEKER